MFSIPFEVVNKSESTVYIAEYVLNCHSTVLEVLFGGTRVGKCSVQDGLSWILIKAVWDRINKSVCIKLSKFCFKSSSDLSHIDSGES